MEQESGLNEGEPEICFCKGLFYKTQIRDLFSHNLLNVIIPAHAILRSYS